MRALAGPMMLLVVIGGFGLHRALSKPDSPPREFLDLELGGTDPLQPGSCYSLSTVLVASTLFLDVTRTWEMKDDDAWTLTLESLQSGANGPVHVFQTFGFKQRDAQVHLVSVDASEGLNTNVRANIDGLLEGPHERRSTPVDRCREPGASGYQFSRK